MDDCIRTLDGGYAITQFYSDNAYVAFMDSNFYVKTALALNVHTGFKSAGFSIAQSIKDSSFCIGGITSNPNRPEYDILIAHISKRGVVKSINTYLFGGADGGDIKVLSLPQGGFLMAAEGSGSVGLISLNNKCAITKVKSLYYQQALLEFNDMIATKDKGHLLIDNVYYGGGTTYPRDIYAVKIDSVLRLKWTRLYHTGQLSEIEGAIKCSDNGYLLCGGETDIFNSNNQFTRLLKIDSAGHIQWHKLGRFSDNGSPNFGLQTKDSGYVMAGTSDIFKIDKRGNVKWVSDLQTILSYGLVETPDKGFVTFRNYYDPYFNILKISDAGKSCSPDYKAVFNVLPDSLSEENASFILTNSYLSHIDTGTIVFRADTTSQLVCTATTDTGKFLSVSNLKSISENALKINLYPNPAKNNATVQLNTNKAGKYIIELTDISGKLLQTKTITAISGTNKIGVDINRYAQGVYIITITDSGNNKRTLKFTKE